MVSRPKENASESLTHVHTVGELVTLLGGHPSLKIGSPLETERHDIEDILRESLEHEKGAQSAHHELSDIVGGRSVLLAEYVREMISDEELRLDKETKMLRRPGDMAPYKG